MKSLHELARHYGIETQYVYKTIMDAGDKCGHELRNRPENDIALDLLGKLPRDSWRLECENERWQAFTYRPDECVSDGTLIEAVEALANRAIAGGE